jgi:hypothetical protein
MENIIAYYDYLMFGKRAMLWRWLKTFPEDQQDKKIGLQSLDEYFNLLLELADNTKLNPEQLKCFKIKLWEKGYKRLAVGLFIQLDDQSQHMISYLNRTEFVTDDDQSFPYYRIRRVLVQPDLPKFSKETVEKGMIVRMKNKRFTGNLYRVTDTHRKTFDMVNKDKPQYAFPGMEYKEIDEIVE